MTIIGTSTATNAISNAFGYPPNTMMDVNPVTGDLWIVFQDATNRGAVWKSTNKGASWSSMGNFTIAAETIEDIQEMRIDSSGRDMHLSVLCSNGSTELMAYKRVDISSGSADFSHGAVAYVPSSGSSQSVYYSSALCPVVNPDGTVHVFLAVTSRGATSGVRVYVVSVDRDHGTTLINDAVIGPTRQWRVAYDDAQATVSIDLEHNGDGITSSNPNMWVTWQTNTTIYCVRCVWKGYKAGWQTPTSASVVASASSSERDVHGRWDGKRFVIMSPSTSNTQQMMLYERNAANTANAAVRTSPANGVGAMAARVLSYNHVTQDPRIFAVFSSQINWIDYIRATNSWGSWTATTWGNPIGGSNSEWGVRRGTAYTGQFDAYTETGASSPWNITSQHQVVNFAPTAPTWVTGIAGTVDQNGAAFDVSSSLLLDWDFHDPGTDSQSAFALTRQIGAGTVQWWRTSDNTWQTVETWNTSGTTSITLTTSQWVGGGGAGDPAHVYKVATKDAPGAASPYSDGLALVPSTRVDPTVTSPTVDQILSTSVVPVTWTDSEQSAWRVQIKPSIANDNFSRTVSNGWGTADYGGPWTITGAGATSEYSVSSGTGRTQHTALNQVHQLNLNNVLAANINVLVGPISLSATPTGASIPWGLMARFLDSNNFVDVRVFFNNNSIPTVVTRYLIGGVETLTSFYGPGGISGPGPVMIRFVANETDLMARMWNPSNPEPTAWQVTLANCPIVAAGPIIVYTVVGTGVTNTLPITAFTDGLIIQDVSLTSYDSGWVTDPTPSAPSTQSLTPSTTFPDGFAGLLTLQTKNAEGLSSVLRTVPFSVDFVEPVTPTFTALASSPASGGNTFTASIGSPSGSQPATTRMSIYRRVALAGTTSAVNANPFFETNASDWTSAGFSTIARSTVQFHQGVASLLCTPDGTTASPKAQTTALYAVTAGTLYEWRGWLRPTTANKPIRCYIDWYDNTPTLLGSSVRDLTSVAGVWLFGSFQATAPLAATQARIAFGELSTPAAGDTIYGDELQLMVANPDPGFRVVANAQSGVSYLDWRAVTGVDYEYRAHVQASNGTDAYGPWYR